MSLNEISWQWFSECRRRLLRSMALTFVVALCLLPFAKSLFQWFSSPLWQHLPGVSRMIAINLFNGFWVPLELSLASALALTVPWWLLEAWWLIKPALYRHERQWLRHVLLASLVLFWLGLMFAYVIALPLMIRFLLYAAPAPVVVMPDIAVYLGFSLRLLLTFGLIFELPLLMLLAVQLGLVSLARLQRFRRYALVLAFVVGMILAPDPFSQCLLALPLYALYEAGLWCANINLRK